MPGRNLGGTVREHDQPRLRTRNCFWLGLIVVACAPAALLRSNEDAAGAMRSADPIDLAAQRVLVWNEAGEQWVVLGGEVAVLQGAEGLRARAAVVRIIEVTDEAGKSFQADIYAEGDVRITGRETAPKLQHRAVLRTAKQIQLSPYKPTGLTAFKEPPVGLKILQRSGLQQPSPPAAGQARSNQSAPSQSRPRAVTESSLTAPLEASPSPVVGSAGRRFLDDRHCRISSPCRQPCRRARTHRFSLLNSCADNRLTPRPPRPTRPRRPPLQPAPVPSLAARSRT